MADTKQYKKGVKLSQQLLNINPMNEQAKVRFKQFGKLLAMYENSLEN